MLFTLRNLKRDLEDVGSNFDGAPDLEFRMATAALELENSARQILARVSVKTSTAGVAGGPDQRRLGVVQPAAVLALVIVAVGA